jgi:hypothetical protein
MRLVKHSMIFLMLGYAKGVAPLVALLGIYSHGLGVSDLLALPPSLWAVNVWTNGALTGFGLFLAVQELLGLARQKPGAVIAFDYSAGKWMLRWLTLSVIHLRGRREEYWDISPKGRRPFRLITKGCYYWTVIRDMPAGQPNAFTPLIV